MSDDRLNIREGYEKRSFQKPIPLTPPAPPCPPRSPKETPSPTKK